MVGIDIDIGQLALDLDHCWEVPAIDDPCG
jgi:hypothetical protein